MVPLPLRFRVIVAICIVLILSMVVVMRRDSKLKNEYQSLTGTLVSINKQYRNRPTRDGEKLRYLQVANYPYVFEVFIGKDFGDFKPKFEQVDHLRPGDVVTAYYYETDDVKSDGINRHVKFIDKNGESYFEAGNATRYVGIVVIVLCILLSIVSYFLWKKQKIAH